MTTSGKWLERGRMLDVLGHSVFAIDEGAARPGKDRDPILILHGFPSSSLDFHVALPKLAERRRVVVHDHLGFGFSDKPEGYSYSLIEQADVALLVWRALGITRGHVVAHDYGTSIATELLARHLRGLLPIEIASLTLSNGSVHLDLAKPRLTQKLLRNKTIGPIFARMASYRVFRAQMRRIFGRPDAVAEEEISAMWEGIRRGEGRLRLAKMSWYQDDRDRFHERWISALERFDRPAHVLWGRLDPIAIPLVAETLAREIPGAKLTWLDAIGHYPMLEDADAWTSALLPFLDG